MGRRAGSQIVSITSMGRRDPGEPRRRISVGGALAAGLAVLLLYGVISLIVHVVVATVLWVPSVITAGYVSTYLRRRGIVGLPRLILGIVVLIGVHVGLFALIHAL